MAGNEPINFREWSALTNAGGSGRLFTCGRPGRATFGRDKGRVNNHIIDQWVEGLPRVETLQIISLLGQKKGGFSEFGYYPFRSTSEVGTKPTFQEWLDHRYGQRFVLHEFPTVDAQGIPPDILKAVTRHVIGLIRNGSTVVVIDSAGAERTARVCEAIGYQRMSHGA